MSLASAARIVAGLVAFCTASSAAAVQVRLSFNAGGLLVDLREAELEVAPTPAFSLYGSFGDQRIGVSTFGEATIREGAVGARWFLAPSVPGAFGAAELSYGIIQPSFTPYPITSPGLGLLFGCAWSPVRWLVLRVSAGIRVRVAQYAYAHGFLNFPIAVVQPLLHADIGVSAG